MEVRHQKESRKRGRSAGTATTGSERRNVRRVSAGEGMSSMATSMNTAATTLANAMTMAASTVLPAPIASAQPAGAIGNGNLPVAIALIQANEGFSDDDIVDAAECVTANPDLATTYVTLNSSTARSRFIRRMMVKFRAREGKREASP